MRCHTGGGISVRGGQGAGASCKCVSVFCICVVYLPPALPSPAQPTTQKPTHSNHPTNTRPHPHTIHPFKNQPGVEPATCLSSAELHVRAAALVFLNGNILGLHRRPRKFVHAMRWGGPGLVCSYCSVLCGCV